jgi:hypothetical protein
MGLSICHSIIESHNGRIWVSPGVAGGSIFQLELPTKSDQDAGSFLPHINPQPFGHGAEKQAASAPEGGEKPCEGAR